MLSQKHFLNYNPLKPFSDYLRNDAGSMFKEMNSTRFRVIKQLNTGEEYRQIVEKDQNVSSTSSLLRGLDKPNQSFIPFISERDGLGRMIIHNKQQSDVSSSIQFILDSRLGNNQSISINNSKGRVSKILGQSNEKDVQMETKLLRKQSVILLNDIQLGKKKGKPKSQQVLGLKNTEFYPLEDQPIQSPTNHEYWNVVDRVAERQELFKLRQSKPLRYIFKRNQSFIQRVNISRNNHIQDDSILQSMGADNEFLTSKPPQKAGQRLFASLKLIHQYPIVGQYDAPEIYETISFPKIKNAIICKQQFDSGKYNEIKKMQILNARKLEIQKAREHRTIQQRLKDKKLAEKKAKSLLKLPILQGQEKYISEFFQQHKGMLLKTNLVSDFKGFPKDFERSIIDQKRVYISKVKHLKNKTKAWGSESRYDKEELLEQANIILEAAGKK